MFATGVCRFALGQVPGSAAGSQFAHHVQGPVIRRAFGWFLVTFGLAFTTYRISTGPPR